MRKRLVPFLILSILLLAQGFPVLAAPAEQEILPRPQITAFTSSATAVDRAALNNRATRVPVSWTTQNRPNSANLVFEQVLPDGRVVNVELPRQNPWVASNGDGIATPFPPGAEATNIVLRVRLIDFVKITVYDEKTLTLPIGDQPQPTPTIRAFTPAVNTVTRASLNNRTARIPVAFAIDNRPPNSNLVFEQVLDSGQVANVELPRPNPIIPSSGNGVVAPFAPGGATTAQITLRLRVINLTNSQTLVQQDMTIAVTDAGTLPPSITTFAVSANKVGRVSLNNRTARIPLAFAVDNRPPNSNLVFEQVLDSGQVVNVELPRQNPIVPSSGNGMVAPFNPGAGTVVKLQLRLIDLSSGSELAKKEATVPVDDTAPTFTIDSFATSAASVSRIALNNRAARIPVSWLLNNRPPNSNLVFEQVLDSGQVVNVELPRQNPIVPSSGNGVAATVNPGTGSTVKLQVRLINLTNGSELAKKELTLPINDTGAGKISFFTTTAALVAYNSLGNRSARIPVSWSVDNRPANSNLVFEQVLDNITVLNVELPRQNPIVPSSGNGVAAPYPPLNASSSTITLRLRLIDLGSSATLDTKEITIPVTGGNQTVWEKVTTDCYSSGFPQGNGLIVGGRGRITPTMPNGRITVANASNAGQIIGDILAGDTFKITAGPDCYKASGGGLAKPIFLRMWKVSAESKTLEGWVSEYFMDSATGATQVYLEALGTSGSGTSGAPEVTTFTANPASVEPGDTVTLAWEVKNASFIALSRLSPDTNAVTEELTPVQTAATGSMNATIPQDYFGATAAFELVARNPAGQEARKTVSVQVSCPFSNALSETCPFTQETVNATYQPFERGFMVWNGSTRKIYAMFNDGTWQEFNDTWQSGEPQLPVVAEQPPAGMFVPVRGFGKVWSQIGGQSLLGWATAEEVGYQAQWETHPLADGGPVIPTPHFKLPDGRVVHLNLNWSFD